MLDCPEFIDSALVARFCASCGMCCNGVLFDGMILQSSDSMRELAALGLKVKRKSFIPQPCTAHQGKSPELLCRIYPQRPQRCQMFFCRQLRLLADGLLVEEEVKSKIDAVRLLVEEVQGLLQETGDERKHKPLSLRVASVFMPPVDSSVKAIAARERLVVVMQELDRVLAEDFRVPED